MQVIANIILREEDFMDLRVETNAVISCTVNTREVQKLFEGEKIAIKFQQILMNHSFNEELNSVIDALEKKGEEILGKYKDDTDIQKLIGAKLIREIIMINIMSAVISAAIPNILFLGEKVENALMESLSLELAISIIQMSQESISNAYKEMAQLAEQLENFQNLEKQLDDLYEYQDSGEDQYLN